MGGCLWMIRGRDLVWVLIMVMVSRSYGELQLNDDVLGLIVFKADLHDPRSSLSTWNEDDASPCNWTGIKCNPKTKRVTEVVLDNLALSGKIGRGLARLESLRTLSLAYNNFSGDISPDLAQITSLKIVNLNHNALSGTIPSQFFEQCTSLRVLSLAHNALEGPLPPALCSCTTLAVLNFSANHLSGSLPSKIWSLTNLRSLDLSYNSLAGGLPMGIGALIYLREIHLQKNNFSGPIPSDIGDPALLKILDFSHNVFSGSLPESLQRLNFLSSLSLSSNLLVGTVPSWIGNMKSLETLDFSSNSLTGNLPDSVGALQYVRFINVSNNKLSGAIPESILGCSRLFCIDLSKNSFSGNIPGELFELGLQGMNLSGNHLTGSIPHVASSNLYKFLQALDLSHNMLSGEVPSVITMCSNLNYLNLSGNLIDGKIPSEVGNLRSLNALDLSNNHLNGNIPAALGDAGALSVLQLDGNFLTGRIPGELGKCSSLTLLSLSHNNLTGHVPKELAKLRRLKVLNLATNNLTGELPQQLGNLGSLLAVNVSHNRLKGRIPTGGIFNTLNKTSLEGNVGLCGAGVNVTCPMVLPKPIVLNPNSSGSAPGTTGLIKSRHSRIVLSVSAIIAISAAAVIAFGVVAVTVLNIRAQTNPRSPNHVLDSFSQSPSTDMSLGKLVMFTPNADHRSEDWVTSAHALLNKDCELGRGGFGTVYKAVLGDGRVVAIKKLMVSSMVKSQEDFEKEVQLLGKIKHPCLVSLQGYYWTPQLQLLMYDYIHSGSLYSRLHEKSQMDVPLTWSSRFNIALGTARGLAHLHHACRPPVIHYNIKSSNILLDEDCNPKIADYGLAKLLPMLDRYILSSRMHSALGYMAPEFACQSLKINEKCDVYGFGVLLLELVTGRRPVEYMEDDVVILCDNVRSLLDEGKALTCVDSTLSEYPEDEVTPVIKLGLICTSQVPSNRPSMAEVIQILELIKSPVESRELL
eukprot:Gb_36314 [translate_table: standard]